MFTRSHLPSSVRYNHRCRNHSALHGLHLSMVWAPHKSHQRPRPMLYLAFWMRTRKDIKHQTEPVYSIPPSNRWPIRVEEPMDQTVLTCGDRRTTYGLEQAAFNCHGHAQQL